MANGPTSSQLQPGLLRRWMTSGRLAVRLLREPRVPLLFKLVPAAAIAYVLFPFDVAPDFLPVLGQLDDLAILLGAAEVFVKLCPSGPSIFHRDAIARGERYAPMKGGDDVIDAEWRRD